MKLHQVAPAAIALMLMSVCDSTQAEPTPTELIDALNGVFGRHPGARASHAHGFCASGEFRPSAQAAQLSRAKHFSQASVPALIRFSVGGGNPRLSDKSRSVRGMAVRLHSADGSLYDLVMISEPVFFASTPEAFVSFLKARTPDARTGKADPEGIKAHDIRYPSSRNQAALLSSHPAPASYASTAYFSNHAFRLSKAPGLGLWVRLQLEPAAGTVYLDPESEKAFPNRFLEAELQHRLVKTPAVFALMAQPAAPGDSLNDPSVSWRSDGPAKLALGHLLVRALTTVDSCDRQMFVPTVLPDGIEPSDDPVLKARAAAYGVSLSRRLR